MLSLDNILGIGSLNEFTRAAKDLYHCQSERCGPYKEYIALAGLRGSEPVSIEKIPFLPIELFKSAEIYCGEYPPEITFSSSSTGGANPSLHHVAFVADYEKTFNRAFSLFYGDPSQWGIYALLPGYLERKGSSLVYMADQLISQARSGGFYLYGTVKLLRDMEKDRGAKILLGVTYSLLELAQERPLLSDTVVMETGGMKGKREELVKADLHEKLCRAFSVGSIHSEYGMAELSSQAYSKGKGIFRCPPG